MRRARERAHTHIHTESRGLGQEGEEGMGVWRVGEGWRKLQGLREEVVGGS